MVNEYETAGEYIHRHAEEFKSRVMHRIVAPTESSSFTDNYLSDVDTLVNDKLLEMKSEVPLEPEMWISWRTREGKLAITEIQAKKLIFERVPLLMRVCKFEKIL